MKRIFPLIFVLFLSFNLNAQIISIPDPYFKAKLVAANTSNGIAKNSFGNSFKIDVNSNGEIEVSEALNVYQLIITTNVLNTTADLTNLSGIEYFTNLRAVNCSGNSISSLNLTTLTNLEELKANNNTLTSVNITGVFSLKKIDFNHNLLTSININNFSNLTELFIYDNQLTALNFSNNPNLANLNCRMNAITSLDLTGLTSLYWVSCDSNQLTSLNVSGLTHIYQIECGNNLLTSLNVSGLSTLGILGCEYNQINTLNVSSLSALWKLNCSSNPISNLNVNGLNSLGVLTASATLVTSLNCSQSGVTELAMDNCPNLQTINLQNNHVSMSDPDLLYYSFRIHNNPQLISICIDNGEQNNLLQYYNATGNNYNTSGTVVVYTGPTCSTVVPMTFGVDDFTDENLFVLYPNPVTDELTVDAGTIPINVVSIYNALGQLIKTVENETVITVSDLSSGTYIISVETDKGKSTQKFIKL